MSHFDMPPVQQDAEINMIAGTLTFAIVLIVMAVCKWVIV